MNNTLGPDLAGSVMPPKPMKVILGGRLPS